MCINIELANGDILQLTEEPTNRDVAVRLQSKGYPADQSRPVCAIPSIRRKTIAKFLDSELLPTT